MRRCKVLHLIKSLGRGGAEMLLPQTLQVHDRSAFEFHYIYFLPWKDQMVQSLVERGGIVTCFSASNNIALMLKARAVARYVRENEIVLIHAHLPWAGILARLVGKMTGVPVVYTEHNKQERYHFLTRFMNLSTMNWLTRVLAVSNDVEQSIRKHKKDLRAPLQTVLNGVNTRHFVPGAFDRNQVRQLFGIPSESPVIGTIAVFRFQKRLDVWIRLAGEILKKHPDAHFIIVGDGPLKNELTRIVRESGLEDRVHFAGLQIEVRPYLAAFDLYMMTSVFEGLPVALLEAMAMACPVISTDAGGIREVIRHGKDGLLCGVDEYERLLDFAPDLLTNEARRRDIGLQGRERVVASFSMEKMVSTLEAIYAEINEKK